MKSIFKKIILILAVVLIGAQPIYAASKGNRKYVDAKTLTIINKAQEDGLPFCRIDASKYDAPKGAKEYLSQSTGLAVVFRSNSNAIHARWTTTGNKLKANMTPTFQSGLDLYIREGEEWVFAGIARTNSHGTNHEFTLVKCMADGEREFMIYLPMFNGVSSLEIGVDKVAPLFSVTVSDSVKAGEVGTCFGGSNDVVDRNGILGVRKRNADDFSTEALDGFDGILHHLIHAGSKS